MRALAIGLVMYAHGAQYIPLPPSALLSGLWSATGPAGVLGVELFFGLSGFLIGGILLDLEQSGADARAVAVFLVRRWMRTLPLYWLTLAALVLIPALDPVPHGAVWPFAVMAQSLARPFPGLWFGTSWSLVIEEWSYLLLPVLAFAAVPGRRHRVVLAALLLVLAGLLIRGIGPGGDLPWGEAVRKVAAMRPDAIAYGVLLAWWQRRVPDIGAARRAALLAAAGLACLAAGLGLLPPTSQPAAPLTAALGIALLGLGGPLLLPMAQSLRPPRWLAQPVGHVARVSYGLYLVHWPVMYAVRWLPEPVRLAVYLGGSLAVASLLAVLVEYPIMRLRPAARQRVGAGMAQPAG